MSEKMVNLKNFETSATSLESKLQKGLECPVCLNIPRKLPIPCCPAGHILCTTCRKGMQTCPTCRRQLGDNTNSLAASMIENVSHNCKYSEKGCNNQDKLAALVVHEASCPLRTIRCPKPFGWGCGKMIPLKDFLGHAGDEHNLGRPTSSSQVFTLTATDIQWDGIAVAKGKEFDCEKNLNYNFQLIKGTPTTYNFYIAPSYYAKEKCFLFFVMVQEDSKEAKKVTANIKLVNNEKDIVMSFEGPVLPLEEVPSNEEQMMDNPGCFKVNYRAMRDIFTVDKKDGNMCRVKFATDVAISLK